MWLVVVVMIHEVVLCSSSALRCAAAWSILLSTRLVLLHRSSFHCSGVRLMPC